MACDNDDCDCDCDYLYESLVAPLLHITAVVFNNITFLFDLLEIKISSLQHLLCNFLNYI